MMYAAEIDVSKVQCLWRCAYGGAHKVDEMHSTNLDNVLPNRLCKRVMRQVQ